MLRPSTTSTRVVPLSRPFPSPARQLSRQRLPRRRTERRRPSAGLPLVEAPPFSALEAIASVNFFVADSLSSLSSSSSSSSLSTSSSIMPPPPFLRLTEGERHALALSTLAGLSTTLGALVAVVRRPDAADLALLLGVALGVMGVLSVCEMWFHNAAEHGPLPVTLAFVAGAAAYALLAPLLPEVGDVAPPGAAERWGIIGGGGGGSGSGSGSRGVGESQEGKELEEEKEKLAASSSTAGSKTVASSRGGGGGGGGGDGKAWASDSRGRGGAKNNNKNGDCDESSKQAATTATATTSTTTTTKAAAAAPPPRPPPPPPLNTAQLLRLGFVMSVAMTLHNFPEGFAVAFSSFTPLGPLMAAAIALHNVPEGVVVAAPVFAATGSRLAALALATASGMSEPLGAAAALFLARPWMQGVVGGSGGGGGGGGGGAEAAAAAAAAEARLALILAAAGGVMASVCVVDLLPQGRRCGAPGRLAAGTAAGAVAMAATLALGA